MKSILFIENKSIKEKHDIWCIEVFEKGEPEYVLTNLKLLIKKLQANNTLTFVELINELLKLKKYSDEIEEGNDWNDFTINITYEDNYVTLVAVDRNEVECLRKTINTSIVTGNCIDDFINRGIEPLLNDIENLKDEIKFRKDERMNAIEYHQTSCYEKDFAQILLIKQITEKITNNCKTHLERISEFYTKLE